LVAFRLGPSQYIFLPVRRATLPSSTNSVNVFVGPHLRLVNNPGNQRVFLSLLCFYLK
jgi:hypothetical protein